MVIIVGTRFILLALLMLIPASFLFFSGIYGAKVTIKEWQPPPSKPSQQSKLNKNIIMVKRRDKTTFFTSKNNNQTHTTLQKDIPICCIQTARLQEIFCPCGRTIPETLLEQYK